MICKVSSADLHGTSAYEITVEADVSGGLPGFYMVGLPSSEVREAKERVIRAIINSGFDFPARKVTINLSPAYIRKKGSGLDLPIAIAILAAMGIVKKEALGGKLFIGELSLDGSINKVRGVLSVAIFAKNEGYECVVVPAENAFEGSVIDGLRIHSAVSLKELVCELNRGEKKDVDHVDLDQELKNTYIYSRLDFADVIGQEHAKRATLVAASGFHNIIYIGPPGSGKSMMARRIPSIFSCMSAQECLEVSKIYSVAGLLENEKLVYERPFRAPNQGITDPALIGGARVPRPGEITLAHKGVLFLDEMTEFKKSTIDQLRIPLESGRIIISRTGGNVEYPCSFMLAAATNPCKCGYFPDRRFCQCSESEVNRYMGKIQGPILDRIDICVGVSRVEPSELKRKEKGMTSRDMREMADRARAIQRERFKGSKIMFNAQMDKKLTDKYCILSDEASEVLNKAYERFNMTARGWYRILRVSRTIADLEGSEKINREHVLEAVSYRNSFVGR